METRWSAIEITANSGRSSLSISALVTPDAEGAPPIFGRLWPYVLRADQGWSMPTGEGYLSATVGVAPKPRAFVVTETAKITKKAQAQQIRECATIEILISMISN